MKRILSCGAGVQSSTVLLMSCLGELPRLDIPAGGSAVVTMPFHEPELEPGTEYWLTVRFTLAEDTLWAEQGHEVAWAQFKVVFDVPEGPRLGITSMPELWLKESEAEITVHGQDFGLVFDRQAGRITSFQYENRELVCQGPALNVPQMRCRRIQTLWFRYPESGGGSEATFPWCPDKPNGPRHYTQQTGISTAFARSQARAY